MVIFFGHTFSFEVSKMKQLHGNSSRFVRELMQEERAFISKRVKSTCWSAHTTNKLVEKLKGHAITLVFLPTNASWLNDVERVFADVEKKRIGKLR